MSRDPRLELVLEGLKRLVREENRHSDPPSTHYIPHDVVWWFVRLLSGDETSLRRAFGLLRPPGRPVNPTPKKYFRRAAKAWTLKMQRETWVEINNAVFADRAEPPDERHVRRLVTRHKPLLIRRSLRRRWLARSEERKQTAILRNSRKGKPDSNSG
ncbi:hypothetical protein [Bradyrhizobium sp. DASA03120]|uniref:hypothetical protein n=1 Tax=Bradyrhizobium sp. SMVTL-02 TaxID=3395917 RepID=UPI003F715158